MMPTVREQSRSPTSGRGAWREAVSEAFEKLVREQEPRLIEEEVRGGVHRGSVGPPVTVHQALGVEAERLAREAGRPRGASGSPGRNLGDWRHFAA